MPDMQDMSERLFVHHSHIIQAVKRLLFSTCS